MTFAEELRQAILDNNTIRLQELLDTPGGDINASAYRIRPLTFAATMGRSDCMQLLISDPRTNRAEAPNSLREAAKFGSTECIKILLTQTDIDIDGADRSFLTTATTLAITYNQPECLKLLLSHGANPNNHTGKTNEGITPIMEASVHGRVELVKLLLNYGADVNASSIVYDQRETALSKAAIHNETETMKLLLAHGANIPPEIDSNRFIPTTPYNMLMITRSIKAKIATAIDTAYNDDPDQVPSKNILEMFANKVVFSSDKTLEELTATEQAELEVFIHDSVAQAISDLSAIYTKIAEYDASTQNFILENIYLVDSSIESDFKYWDLSEVGIKKSLVNLAYICGGQVEGIAGLTKLTVEMVQHFMDAIPVDDSDGSICKYSVAEFAFRVVSSDATEKLAEKITSSAPQLDVTYLAQHILGYLSCADLPMEDTHTNITGDGLTHDPADTEA